MWKYSRGNKQNSLTLLAVAFAALAGSPTAQTKSQDANAPPRKSLMCATCHGVDGDSFKPNYPKLAGQLGPYLFRQLVDFKEGRRKDPTMGMIAAGLSREDMFVLADFFASRARSVGAPPADSKTSVAPPDKAPAEAAKCLDCHLSNSTAMDRPPYITGQQYNYLVKQLRDFRSGSRTDDGGVMAGIATALTDSEIDNIAEYLARQHIK
jgi:cytochrome c553